MSDVKTPADGAGTPLKREPAALDSRGDMHIQELKVRIQRADYVVDPVLVATAMLRHAISYRRCWNPAAVCGAPADSRMISGGPAVTDPIHVTGAASSAAARASQPTQKHSS